MIFGEFGLREISAAVAHVLRFTWSSPSGLFLEIIPQVRIAVKLKW